MATVYPVLNIIYGLLSSLLLLAPVYYMALVNTCSYDGCCKKFVLPWTIFEVRMEETIQQFFTKTAAEKELHTECHHLDEVQIGVS